MAPRIASAAVGLPLLALGIGSGGPWFTLLAAAAGAIGALEVCQMARRQGRRPLAPVAAAGAAGLIVGAYFLPPDTGLGTALPAVAGVAGLVSTTWLLRRSTPPALAGWGITVGAASYTGGLLFYGPLLRGLDQGRDWVFVLMAVTFAADSAAFFVGRRLGRRRLAPVLSPSKTWEGAVAGLLGGAVAGAACAYGFDLGIGLAAGLALGGLMGVVGQLGDMGESALKRRAEVKDSGRLIPGHGGVLDRLDSIVSNLVLVYYFVIWAL